MISYQGKYNSATVMVDSIDESTSSQILTFLNHPAFHGGQIVIMPDCHAGKGSCIGFTYQMVNDMIIPNVVGVDINCGMLACVLPDTDIDFASFDKWVREKIPSGFNSCDSIKGNLSWLSRVQKDSFESLSKKVGQKDGKVIESLGTLGGGNHFIEIDKSKTGNHWLVVHSGSRNLGLVVANYHQKKAQEHIESKNILGIPRGMEYLEGIGSQDYLSDMSICQEYAQLNRLFIMRRLLEFFGMNPNSVNLDSLIECSHNYINFQDRIIRKGAISAKKGEKVIIPLSMKAGILVGTGLSNKSWNYSAPHGAGRQMSRSQAKRELNLADFQSEMEGIWTSCVCQSTLDEAPGAYKPSNVITDVIGETVDVEDHLVPVYNFKASEG